MTGPDELLGGGLSAHHEILLAVMSQRFVDDSLQRIIIIRIELRIVSYQTQFNMASRCN